MCLCIVQVELRCRTSGNQVRISARIPFRALKLSLVPGQRGLRLPELRIQRTGIQRDQQITLLDLRTVDASRTAFR